MAVKSYIITQNSFIQLQSLFQKGSLFNFDILKDLEINKKFTKNNLKVHLKTCKEKRKYELEKLENTLKITNEL